MANGVITMEDGDRQWFKDLLKAELNPIKQQLTSLPCVDHGTRITVNETKMESKRESSIDWRTWLLGIGMFVVAALSLYAAFKK